MYWVLLANDAHVYILANAQMFGGIYLFISIAIFVFCNDLIFSLTPLSQQFFFVTALMRSEERRVGKECLRLCISLWPPFAVNSVALLLLLH